MIFEPLWEISRRNPLWRIGRRGYLRPLILKLLSEREMNGSEMIDEIYTRTVGLLDPSPGSIYPLLSKMVKEDLIEVSAEKEGRKIYRITKKGKTLLTTYLEQGHWVWKIFEEEPSSITELKGYLRESMKDLLLTLKEVIKTGRKLREETLKNIAEILSKTAENIRAMAESDRKK